MPLSPSMLESDLQFMLADLPDSLIWQTKTYACARAELTAGDGFHDEAGIWRDDAVQFILAVSAFAGGALPAYGQQLTYGGVVYQIQKPRLSEDGKTIELICTAP